MERKLPPPPDPHYKKIARIAGFDLVDFRDYERVEDIYSVVLKVERDKNDAPWIVERDREFLRTCGIEH